MRVSWLGLSFLVTSGLFCLPARGEDPLVAQLKNATYRCGKVAVHLKDGYAQNPRPEGYDTGFTELAAAAITTSGSRNSDSPDAVVILRRNDGGNAVYFEVHAVRLIKGAPQDVASAGLSVAGVKALAIENGLVKVTGLSFGPNDPHCCPSITKVDVYRVHGKTFEAVSGDEEASGQDESTIVGIEKIIIRDRVGNTVPSYLYTCMVKGMVIEAVLYYSPSFLTNEGKWLSFNPLVKGSKIKIKSNTPHLNCFEYVQGDSRHTPFDFQIWSCDLKPVPAHPGPIVMIRRSNGAVEVRD